MFLNCKVIDRILYFGNIRPFLMNTFQPVVFMKLMPSITANGGMFLIIQPMIRRYVVDVLLYISIQIKKLLKKIVMVEMQEKCVFCNFGV